MPTICNCGLHTNNKKCPVNEQYLDIFLNIAIDMLFFGFDQKVYIPFISQYNLEIKNPKQIHLEIVHMIKYILQTYAVCDTDCELLSILIQYFSTVLLVKQKQVKFLKGVQNGRFRRV